jgi:hypothetical protein
MAGPVVPSFCVESIAMKSVSRFALAFAAASISLTVSSAAWAADEAKPEKPKKEKKEKKGKKEEAAPAAFEPKPSKEFMAVYDPIVKEYTKTKDSAAAAAKYGAIKAAVTTDDDRYLAGIFGLQMARETKNDAMRVEALDLALASAVTPADQRAQYTFSKGAMAYDAKDYPTAETWLIKAHGLGYKANTQPGGIEALIANSFNFQKKNIEALDWYAKAIEAGKAPGATPFTPAFYGTIANVAISTGQFPLIHTWLQNLVKYRNLPNDWSDVLRNVNATADLDSHETLDLLRLMRTVGAMTQGQNYSSYVTETMIALYPTEMSTVLSEGFAAKTITPQNLTFKDLKEEIDAKLASDPFSLATLDKDIADAKTGADASFSGDIALSVGEYARAKGAYETALAKGGLIGPKDGKDFSERTKFRLAVAKAMLGDTAGARTDFAAIQQPGYRVIADYWLIRLDQLAAAATAPAAAPAT